MKEMKYRYYKADSRLLIIMCIFLKIMKQIKEINSLFLHWNLDKFYTKVNVAYCKKGVIKYFANPFDIKNLYNLFFYNYQKSEYFNNEKNIEKAIKEFIPETKLYDYEYLYSKKNLDLLLKKEKQNFNWFTTKCEYLQKQLAHE